MKQEIQLSLTNRATHLYKCNAWRGWPPKTRHTHVLPCWVRSFCVKGCRHKYRRTPKIGERWNSALLGCGWPQDTPLHHVCYLVKFDSSATKGVRINRKEPQNWECWDPAPLGGGVADHLKTSSLPLCVTTWNLVVLRQMGYA